MTDEHGDFEEQMTEGACVRCGRADYPHVHVPDVGVLSGRPAPVQTSPKRAESGRNEASDD